MDQAARLAARFGSRRITTVLPHARLEETPPKTLFQELHGAPPHPHLDQAQVLDLIWRKFLHIYQRERVNRAKSLRRFKYVMSPQLYTGHDEFIMEDLLLFSRDFLGMLPTAEQRSKVELTVLLATKNSEEKVTDVSQRLDKYGVDHTIRQWPGEASELPDFAVPGDGRIITIVDYFGRPMLAETDEAQDWRDILTYPEVTRRALASGG